MTAFFLYKKIYLRTMRVIGLMSGTSLDGIDLVCCDFSVSNNKYSYVVSHSKCIKYTLDWKSKLNNAIELNALELQLLDIELAEKFSSEINTFIKENKIEDIDLISSHGHTVFHQPNKKLSLQIGAGHIIANNCKIDTVCDFRKEDVAKGGQGAPLVPIGDQYLFSIYDYCLNIGGIANVSFQLNDKRVAYDICAANMVFNHYANQKNLEFDEDGLIASSGEINFELLEQLNSLEYYQIAFPKSLGKEWVFKNVIETIDQYDISIENKLRTFTEHIALQIAANCSTWGEVRSNMLVTGGGAYNKFLIEKIQSHTSTEIIIPDKITVDFKEAIIFAFLGYLKYNNINNCLASVTGASHDHSSGVVYRYQ